MINKLSDWISWKWWRLRRWWHGPRGVLTPPPYHLAIEFLEHRATSVLLRIAAALSFILPIVMTTSVTFSSCGLVLDIVGFTLMFREWLIQHHRWVADEVERIDFLMRRTTADEPFSQAEIEEIGPSAERHMYDGLNERARETEVVALNGVGLILLGFIYQLVGIILSCPS